MEAATVTLSEITELLSNWHDSIRELDVNNQLIYLEK